MRTKTLRGAWLLVAWLALAPAVGRAQNSGQYVPAYAPSDIQVPLPYGSTRPEDGGLFTSARYAMFRTNNPLKAQLLAIRGWQASDGTFPRTITGQMPQQIQRIINQAAFNPLTQTVDYSRSGNVGGLLVPGVAAIVGNNIFIFVIENIPPSPGMATSFYSPGDFIGPATPALDVAQLTGESTYMPGFDIGIGWKFRDGSAVTLTWLYLAEAQYRSGATLAPPFNKNNADLSNTFLFSPVFNFPPEFAGADNKVLTSFPVTPAISPQAAFGIWNAASIMTIEFRQRIQQWDITYREPIFETETYRLSGLVGPRLTWIWEKFKWVTTSLGTDPGITSPGGIVGSSPANVGIYSTITSNRMYGVHAGCEQEWYLGHGFAFHLITDLTLYLDSVKERAKYETAAKYYGFPENKRSKREWRLVPEAKLAPGMMWYPTESVQLWFDYEFWGMLNTLASRHPVDFDYAQIAPKWAAMARFFDGFRAGIAFQF